jgi:hypothetical protein
MQFLIPLTFLLLTLVSAKDGLKHWQWHKRSIATNDGPVFIDGPGVVHDDVAGMGGLECSADCKHLHTICSTNVKGMGNGGKCHGMLCAVDKVRRVLLAHASLSLGDGGANVLMQCKGCPVCHVRITGPPEKEE